MNKNNTNRIHFMKMHGVGNDYIFVDTAQCAIPDPQSASIAWSRPHMGIGSDGLVLIGRAETPEADFTMRIFNADGSEGLMCGNASRCIGKYVYERGLTDQTRVRLLTASGIKVLELAINPDGTVSSVTVDMLAPMLEHKTQFLPDGEPLPDGRWATRITSSLSMTSTALTWPPEVLCWNATSASPSAATSSLPK